MNECAPTTVTAPSGKANQAVRRETEGDRYRPMKVSVCMITYNHERFIAQAIDSVMIQEAGFEYELVIGEDCSTDRTREICIEYQRRFPDRIRLLLHEKNVGMIPNFVQTFNACTGQYVALLEGDDYWTTPHKLQKQADFLDTHPDYAVCFGRTGTLVEDNSCEPYYLPPPQREKDTYTVEDLLRGNMIGTCSVMFRNRLFDSFPDWFFGLSIGDWPLHIMNAQHGKVGYIHELMATYRIHGNSEHSSRSLLERLLRTADFYNAINVHLDFKYKVLVGKMQALMYQMTSAEYLRKGDRANARRYAIRSLKSLPLRTYYANGPLVIRSVITFVRTIIPRV